MKVGSLFAGIGGFDLGFERAGFEVAWCVEWDKNAQAVLRKRFPNAKVYGDIREVDPDSLEPVDIVCGGFPCQDLSVAGKRAGLAGERSGLFHDAMRIVRRLNPRLLVLENVPGLLSSNRGLDFATVLREVGEGWDCAEVGWRVLDSQYFGVAQRRRRVFVVAGSRIGCAEEILALAESSGGNPPSRGAKGQGAAVDAEGRAIDGRIVPSLTSKMAKGTGGPSGDECQNLVVGTIDCDIPKQRVQNFFAGHWIAEAFRKSKRAQTDTDDETWLADGLANTLNGFDTGDARTTHAVAHAFYSTGGTHGLESKPDVCPPPTVGSTIGIPSPPSVMYTLDMQGCKGNANVGDGSVSPTLGRPSGTDCHAVAYGIDGEMNASESIIGPLKRGGEGGRHEAVVFPIQDGRDLNKAQNGLGLGEQNSPSYTIDTTGAQSVAVSHATESQGSRIRDVTEPSETLRATKRGPFSDFHMTPSMVVRRLTPVECERLQGFPDGWTDIGTPEKPTSDSPRYKQLGNAVTVNVAEWIARRCRAWLVEQVRHEPRGDTNAG